eukprot:1384716-Rhodomonas_salina.2
MSLRGNGAPWFRFPTTGAPTNDCSSPGPGADLRVCKDSRVSVVEESYALQQEMMVEADAKTGLLPHAQFSDGKFVGFAFTLSM